MKEGQRNFDLPLSNKDQNNGDTEMPASDLKLEILANAEIQTWLLWQNPRQPNYCDVFLELSCFSDDPADVGDLISGSSAFYKSSLDI